MPPGPPHVVDVLIAERAPRLTASVLWPLLRPLVYAALGYRKARALADDVALRGGWDTMQRASDTLRLSVPTRGAERLPATGRVMIICNHPTGLADGVAVFDALKARRPDLLFFANADALRVNPRLAEIFIPVEWVEAKRTRARTRLTLQRAQEALQADRAVVVFAAGRIARRRHGLLTDPPWAPTAVSLARRYHAPILPVHIAGPPSTLFELFDRVSQELRDITLFHELLNKRGRRFTVTFGRLIPAEAIDDDSIAMTTRLKAYVERGLALDADLQFAGMARDAAGD